MAVRSLAQKSHPLLAHVRCLLIERKLISPGSRVLVGVSGGADSVALLRILVNLRSSLRLQLAIVHVNHQLRPEAASNADFVKSLGDLWKVPTFLETEDVREQCAQMGWSIEDGARRVRYACFLKAAKRYSADAVAVAHNADDQAETVLLRLLRGSGLTGMSAIPWKRLLASSAEHKTHTTWVIRPLLDTWRATILEYLRSEVISFREDSTNRDARFLRNRVRHELLPTLESYNPAIRRQLSQLAEQLQWDRECLEELTERYWKRVSRTKGSVLELSLSALKRLSPSLKRLLIRRAIRQVQGDLQQFEFRHWGEVEALLTRRPAGSVVSLPGGVRFVRTLTHVRCMREPAAEKLESVENARAIASKF